MQKQVDSPKRMLKELALVVNSFNTENDFFTRNIKVIRVKHSIRVLEECRLGVLFMHLCADPLKSSASHRWCSSSQTQDRPSLSDPTRSPNQHLRTNCHVRLGPQFYKPDLNELFLHTILSHYENCPNGLNLEWRNKQ